MRRLLTALCLSTLIVTAGAGASAARGSRVIVKAVDKAGDVTVSTNPRAAGPSATQVQSIDIQSVKVVDQGASIRFQVDLLAALPTPDGLDQKIYIDLSPGDRGERWRSYIELSPQSSTSGFAVFDPDPRNTETEHGEQAAEDLAVKVNTAGLVTISVAKRYLPPTPARIVVRDKLSSSTPLTNTVTHSRDKLRVPGAHDLS